MADCVCVGVQVRKQRAKAGMFKVDRQRQLILTTQPRIIYLDPTVKNVKAAIKGVVSGCGACTGR